MSRESSNRLRDRRMNPEVYRLRRKVMKYIYEARSIYPQLPRVRVRITEDHECILGQGRLGGDAIWVTSGAAADARVDLRALVYHELVHAVFNVGHHDDCPLMHPAHAPLPAAECKRIFLQYARASGHASANRRP